MDRRSITRVDINQDNNAWWDDAFQFGDPLDFTWDFNGKSFYLWLKTHSDDPTALLQLSSGAATIVVLDASLRVLAMAVPDTTLRASLAVGKYHYDLIMVDNGTGQTDGLMYGEFELNQGITIGPS